MSEQDWQWLMSSEAEISSLNVNSVQQKVVDLAEVALRLEVIFAVAIGRLSVAMNVMCCQCRCKDIVM